MKQPEPRAASTGAGVAAGLAARTALLLGGITVAMRVGLRPQPGTPKLGASKPGTPKSGTPKSGTPKSGTPNPTEPKAFPREISFLSPAAQAYSEDEPLDNGERGRGEPAEPPSRSASQSGHETEDVSAGTIGKLIAGLGIGAAVTFGGMIALRVFLTHDYDHSRPRLTAEQMVHIKPSAPTLQANPVEELAALHGRENVLLDSYAWLDATHTHGRIPIERAMTLILGHPLDTAP